MIKRAKGYIALLTIYFVISCNLQNRMAVGWQGRNGRCGFGFMGKILIKKFNYINLLIN